MALHVEPPRGDEVQSRDCRDRERSIVVALINNMPDAALQATESQFSALLEAAAGGMPGCLPDTDVRLRFTALREVRRSPASLEHIRRHYWPLEALMREPPDALIVTGAEPIAAALSEEAYWDKFLQVLHWARGHTLSSIWSCLAAHATVLALDGIQRQRLVEKRFGVFEHALLTNHSLLDGIASPLPNPHSRWNDVPTAALHAAGYSILSGAKDTGADVFIKQDPSLLVCFQGHPEYDEATLLKEFRRDVGRFLRGEQANYPTLPRGYFSAAAIELLEAFRMRAIQDRNPGLLAQFPAAAGEHLQHGWRDGAVRLYRNWLSYVEGAKGVSPAGTPAHV